MEVLNEVVDEIEAEQERGMIPAFKVFRSILNQPSLVSISSANAVNNYQTGSGFSNFAVNLPRPIFDVESIQLVNANIPQCSQNIPDTACVFWYYRLSQYSGVVPNANNMYYNRLLPSYYKPESIQNSSNYGFNRTFVSYPDLATELALASVNDLAYYNYSQCVSNFFFPDTQYNIRFLPNDVSLTYNSRFNKFQMTGTNAFTPFATQQWASNTTYSSNAIVYYNNPQSYPNLAAYQSLVNANSNQNPFTATAYWKQIYTDIIAGWDQYTPYRQYAIVTNTTGTTLYQAAYQNHNFSYSNSLSNFPTYSSSYYYAVGDLTSYLGTNYTCIYPTSNHVPTNASYWLPTGYSTGVTYPAGFVATYSNQFWVSLVSLSNRAPSSNSAVWSNIGSNIWNTYTTSLSNPNYRYLSAGYTDPNITSNQGPQGIQNTTAFWNSEDRGWSPYSLYEYNEYIRYNGTTYYAMEQNLNYVPFDTSTSTAWSLTTKYTIGSVVSFNNLFFIATQNNSNQVPTLFSPYWSQQMWTAVSGPEWNSTTTYSIGAIVKATYPNSTQYSYFQSEVNGNVGNSPLSPTSTQDGYWLYIDSPTISLNAISSDFDMVELFTKTGTSNTDLIAPFPNNIPGQPYTPVVRRTLNTILGFTWNGAMTPSQISLATIPVITGLSYSIPSPAVDVYNRLRPIPDYQVITQNNYSNLLLGAVNNRASTSTQTYTADGYANLNFSSIISLYTTIAAASTMDTQQNTNLLATCPMNCANLGVSFFEPKIANEILLHGVELDTISISMFDEFGDPYFITNNGVITITLRMTYKDRLHIK